MAKESMSERNSNPFYFELVTCSGENCQSTSDLLVHRYSGEHMCATCINKLVEKINEEKEREHEDVFGKEGYYTDMSYNQLLQERSA
jgi:hypothetical protein